MGKSGNFLEGEGFVSGYAATRAWTPPHRFPCPSLFPGSLARSPSSPGLGAMGSRLCKTRDVQGGMCRVLHAFISSQNGME